MSNDSETESYILNNICVIFRDALEVLAWASAQIHCLCSTNGKVSLPSTTPYLPEEKVVSNSGNLPNIFI